MTMTRIARAELFELTLPLLEPFVISGGTMTERRSLIVVLHDEAGHVGYGECPPFELPFYSEETLAGARHLIAHVLLPRVVDRELDRPLPEAVMPCCAKGCGGTGSPAPASRRRRGISRRISGARVSPRCSASGWP